MAKLRRSPSLLDLEIDIADDRDALQSLIVLGAHHAGAFDRWRDWQFWAELAREWRRADPKRTPVEAHAHFDRVTIALGIRVPRRPTRRAS
jgi:predicted ATPase